MQAGGWRVMKLFSDPALECLTVLFSEQEEFDPELVVRRPLHATHFNVDERPLFCQGDVQGHIQSAVHRAGAFDRAAAERKIEQPSFSRRPLFTGDLNSTMN